MIPAVISATVLPRLAPRAAAELFLTGDTFDGVRAAAGRPGHGRGARPTSWTRRWPATSTSLRAGRAGRAGRDQGAAAPASAADARDELAELTALSVRFFTSARAGRASRAFAEKRDPAWVPRR